MKYIFVISSQNRDFHINKFIPKKVIFCWFHLSLFRVETIKWTEPHKSQNPFQRISWVYVSWIWYGYLHNSADNISNHRCSNQRKQISDRNFLNVTEQLTQHNEVTSFFLFFFGSAHNYRGSPNLIPKCDVECRIIICATNYRTQIIIINTLNLKLFCWVVAVIFINKINKSEILLQFSKSIC